MLTGGCWVTQSLDHAMPWVFGPVVFRQESRHLAGTAAHLQLQHLVGVNFPFLTSSFLFIFPGRTCLPGDSLDASPPLTGDSRAQLSTDPQPPPSPPPIWRRMGRSPSIGLGLLGLDPSRAPACSGQAGTGHPLGSQSGHASVVCILVAPQLPVLSLPAPG